MGLYLYLGQGQDTTSGLGHIPSEPSIGQVLTPTSGWFFLDPYLSLSLDVHSSLSPENWLWLCLAPYSKPILDRCGPA